MKINIHAGHAPDGSGGASGACGLIKESTEARNVKKYVISYLKKAGHTVYDCTCDDGVSKQVVLDRIIKKCNAHDVDLDVSIHFNDGSNRTPDGKVTGSEVFVYSKSGSQEKIRVAERILDGFAELGLKQHGEGIKVNPKLRFLAETDAPALLVEVCFVGDPEDIAIYRTVGAKRIGRIIAESIHGSAIDITKVTTGDKLKITKKLKIRNIPDKDYTLYGYLHPGAVVDVLEVNKTGTRARIANGLWISTHKDYSTVI